MTKKENLIVWSVVSQYFFYLTYHIHFWQFIREIFTNNQCIFLLLGKKFFENNHLIDHNKAVHNIISETPIPPTMKIKDQEKRKITKTTGFTEKESDIEDKNDDFRYLALF